MIVKRCGCWGTKGKPISLPLGEGPTQRQADRGDCHCGHSASLEGMKWYSLLAAVKAEAFCNQVPFLAAYGPQFLDRNADPATITNIVLYRAIALA